MSDDSLIALAFARDVARNGVARSARLAKHLSLRDLSRELDVAPSTILRWENGDRVPSREQGPAYGRLIQRLLEAS
jgi:transcriptional regulator with XRE-family HTH domain